MATSVQACMVCRRLFNSAFGEMVCPACRDKAEEDLKKVKDYLWKNPNSPLYKVAEDCEVTEKEIKKWLRDGRIKLSEDSLIEMYCEGCGARISSGRFCDKCKAGTINGMNDIIKQSRAVEETAGKKKPVRDKERMRFLDKS